MTGTMMMERPMTGMPGMGMGGAVMPTAPTPMSPNMVMVPRCVMKMEKMKDGMKITCTCSDPTACAMMQNPRDDGWRDGELLLHDERNDGLLLQHDDGHV